MTDIEATLRAVWDRFVYLLVDALTKLAWLFTVVGVLNALTQPA